MFKIPDAVVELLAKRVLGWYDSRKLKRPKASAVEESLSSHLRDIESWSSRVEFSGFASAKATDYDTVGLSLSLPRKYRGAKSGKPLTETHLIRRHGRYLLLGGPGAGKTTTLKRIARHLLHQPSKSTDEPQYPVVVRLRELGPSKLLEEAIADALSIPAERRYVNDASISRKDLARLRQTQPVNDVKEPAGPFYLAAGGESLVVELANVLETSKGLLLLDGLDEMPALMRHLTEDAVVRLLRRVPELPLILTCRSGDYERPIEGLDLLELLPLNERQVAKIVKRWSHNPNDFLEKLKSLAFHDLASRPLFLCQLILLHETTHFIPTEPSTVYRRIVKLALEEWDQQRKVFRESRYAGFDVDRKLEFLSQLAYWLTYELNEKQFTTDTLTRAYLAIAPNFALPAREAETVVRELEAHTGIILNAGYDRYEFAHLSVQEFLAANYLAREPVGVAFMRYVAVNPAPVAVAVALSSTPSKWISRLLLHPSSEHMMPSLRSFLSRVLQEKPSFKPDRELGYAALRLVFLRSEDQFVANFLALPAVQASVAVALYSYNANRHGAGYMLMLARPIGPQEGVVWPERGWIASDYLLPVMATFNVEFSDAPLGVAHHFFTAVKIEDVIRTWSEAV